MSYDSSERSEQAGAPVELYEFAIGSEVYRYTSAEIDMVVGSETYTSAPITRDAIERSPERVRNNLTLTVPRTFEIADRFRVSPPAEIIAVTVLRFHREDEAQVVLWLGRVLNCEWRGGSAALTCEPVSTSLQRTGLRRKYQRQCPFALYSAACGVNRADHDITTTVTAISGAQLTVAALLSKPYAGGFVEWVTDEGVTERRFITEFSGLVLTLVRPFSGIAPADSVTVLPGDDHTMATCKNVFNNLPNYGGFPYTPRVNPFDGTPVY